MDTHTIITAEDLAEARADFRSERANVVAKNAVTTTACRGRSFSPRTRAPSST